MGCTRDARAALKFSHTRGGVTAVPLGKGGAAHVSPARVESANSKKRAFSSPFPSVARNCFTCFSWRTRGALEIPHTAGGARGVFFPPVALGSPSALAKRTDPTRSEPSHARRTKPKRSEARRSDPPPREANRPEANRLEAKRCDPPRSEAKRCYARLWNDAPLPLPLPLPLLEAMRPAPPRSARRVACLIID